MENICEFIRLDQENVGISSKGRRLFLFYRFENCMHLSRSLSYLSISLGMGTLEYISSFGLYNKSQVHQSWYCVKLQFVYRVMVEFSENRKGTKNQTLFRIVSDLFNNKKWKYFRSLCEKYFSKPRRQGMPDD